MAIILGINNGHHASCAIVKDGKLVAGIEQERVTRIKGDGSNYLSNILPINQVLRILDITMKDVDLIVSSFQAIGPGGVGLIQPLFDRDFSLFDPFDKRHHVLSHHLAHAFSAAGTSGYDRGAVLVCDLAGSTTSDGKDFALSFDEFYRLVSTKGQGPTKTECLSIYKADKFNFDLRYREFVTPHCSPEVFVSNASALYDNVSRFIFGKENAHGELMALASMNIFDPSKKNDLDLSDIIKVKFDQVVFKNSWQCKVKPQSIQTDYAPLAAIVQRAFQRALITYARKTKSLTGEKNLATAGGAFLNITANSAIHASRLFHNYHVPSSPHDAGVAIGCAYFGWNILATARNQEVIISTKKASDRIGSSYSENELLKGLKKKRHACSWIKSTPIGLAKIIAGKKIVARFSGPAEFGPRALGGRSLLASPLYTELKNRLNIIKGRQNWRPVAPIITKEKLSSFFLGPEDSPYMNMAHTIRAKCRSSLKGLFHPDNSARVQTIEKDDDPFLHETLVALESITGYPIIVNTSLNGPNSPILETPEQALDFFLENEEVDYLLLEELLVRKAELPNWFSSKLADDVLVSSLSFKKSKTVVLIMQGKTEEISCRTLEIIKTLPQITVPKAARNEKRQIIRLLRLGFMVPFTF